MTELAWLDATAQAELVRSGELPAKELVEAAIARVEALNPKLDAVTWTRYDDARAEAAGEVSGPFAGVPTLFKDLGCSVAGEPLAYGLGPLREFRWPVTSYLAEQFGAAGFINLGRSNVPEMGRPSRPSRRAFHRHEPVESRPLDRRLVGRCGRSGRQRHGADRARERRRRLDPDPGQ